MTTARRWTIAIVMAVVLIAIFVPIFYIGYALGGFATDSCSDLPDAAYLWLTAAWPVVLLATALTGPILIVRQARWRWVWISLGVGLVVSACCYVGWWFPWLTLMCG